ncbi:hypothetical protein FPV67DRAFT_19827 [Lyophyllum atratum]|nr:hypothetical protein FPV67DRAFT_19827 [Lyophyllum atratum]
MFRAAVPRIPLVISPIARRKFVSSVLLTRTWENESVAGLRKELKNRGLSPKGNKANLILQIQEYERHKTIQAIASHEPPLPATVREMATSAAASTDEGVAPGVPPASQPTRAGPEGMMNVNIPDIWQPVPEQPIQIPYVPDFWDSSLPAISPVPEEPLPKLLVVAGADTHLSGGPSHNLHDENAVVQNDSARASASKPQEEGGILDDITDDLGIPRPKELKAAFWRVFA